MTDPRIEGLGRLTASLKTARAEMAAGQPSLACLIGVMAVVYQQADEMRSRWKGADLAAFEAMKEALAEHQDEYSIEDYEEAAAIVEATYRKAHKTSAVDAVETVLKYAWVQIALCNAAVFDAVAFAAMMSMIDFYLEPVGDFPDTINTALRGVLFGAISGPMTAAEVADGLEHVYTGEAALRAVSGLERAVMVGVRIGLSGTVADTKAAYWYYGPEDDRNRTFCRAMISGTNAGHPRLYTAEMIGGCRNGQTGSVWQDCGGFNCRHVWLAVPKDQRERFERIGKYTYRDFLEGKTSGRYVVPVA